MLIRWTKKIGRGISGTLSNWRAVMATSTAGIVVQWAALILFWGVCLGVQLVGVLGFWMFFGALPSVLYLFLTGYMWEGRYDEDDS